MNISLGEILGRLKIDSLNEMQHAFIEASRRHDNLVLISPTGSGKTLAFILPILERLKKEGGRTTNAIIIVPSRELALQIEKVFRSTGTSFKVTCCYGGHKREIEENNLVEPPALLIGTPGRLADHIRRGNISTATISTLVLDEFDKSLEEGFEEEMAFIIQSLPAIKKRVLTSATEMIDIPAFVGLEDAVKLNFAGPEPRPEKLAFKIVDSPEKDKLETLYRLICTLGNRSTVIFCNHRESVERTNDFLKQRGIINVFYHGAMEQQEREIALFKFRSGTASFLVTTDLAARGLDIPHIRYIVHYHLPQTEEVFTHRNGRTARMDASGTVILIIGPGEERPAYIPAEAGSMELPENGIIPDKPQWSTIFIAGGKKNKINKVDIVGFLGNKAHLKKEDIGLIEVKDFSSFVAVRRSKVGETLRLVQGQKIKNQKVRIEIAK